MNKKKILVIDDEESIRKSFSLALDLNKYEVITADSAEAGLRIFNSKSIDLIFMDLSMPGMNGVEAVEKIREKDIKVPICIVTAFWQKFSERLEDIKEKGYQYSLLKKPIGLNQISEIVDNMLST